MELLAVINTCAYGKVCDKMYRICGLRAERICIVQNRERKAEGMPDFKVTRYKIRIDGNGNRPERPFSVVLLSDLHNVSYGEANSRLLQEIKSQNPALILIAGDMLTQSGIEPDTDAAIALLDGLTGKYPVYYANGNHECRLKLGDEQAAEYYERYVARIRRFGVHMLENRRKATEACGMKLRIWGVEIPMDCYRRGKNMRLTAEHMQELLGEPDEHSYNILLAHHPMCFDAYASWGADLTLSGHLHGGIVRLPVLGGVISPQMRLFPKYDRGLFAKDGRKLIVSGGMGSHTIPLRINNPPELVVIDIV